MRTIKRRKGEWVRLSEHAGARTNRDLKEALRLAAEANDETMSDVLRRALEREVASLLRKVEAKRKRRHLRVA